FFIPLHLLLNKYYNDLRISNYANVIISYRKGKIEEAVEQLDSLIKDSHKDPYLYELKAQVLYKAGRLNEAIENYKKSIDYLPYNSDPGYLIKLALSHTLLLSNRIKEAISNLEEISHLETSVLYYLSIAYKRDKNLPMFYFSSAKKAFFIGNIKQFKKYAKLALLSLPKNSAYSMQVSDLLNQIDNNYGSEIYNIKKLHTFLELLI
ncbi:tetratricopeptide repeat protein, partial [Wolbachia endosymbiont of Pentidionis agamae]|uniref:tetratricopeptide repeat protein n=1 Tax=Wolbachia endosymbiont of Pentidionis agamae TaxID=3110435 RepID=UPI0038CD67D7